MTPLSTIDRVLEQFSQDGGPGQPLIDFTRPFFLKDDPATGADTFNQVLAAPAAEAHLDLVKRTLNEHLVDNPEGLHKLQALLEK